LEVLRSCGEFRHTAGRKRSSASIARKLSNEEKKVPHGFENKDSRNPFLE